MATGKIKISNINKLIGIFFAVSLLVHALIMLFVYKYPLSSQELKNRQENDAVEVKLVSPRESQNILNNLKGQVVDLVDTFEPTKPDNNTKYLSDKDRRVEKEVQAPLTGNNPNTSFSSMGGGERRDLLTFDKPDPPGRPGEEQSDKNGARLVIGEKKAHGDKSKNSLNLQPTQEELSRFFAVAPNNYLPSVEIGNATLLNTAAYAYAGFFVRMKRQMEAIWNPQPILYRTSVEKKSFYRTSVNIVLNGNGSLASVEIDRSSGVAELDSEAIRTIKLSAPFPNPPKELQSPDQKIYIPDWNFIITFERGIF